MNKAIKNVLFNRGFITLFICYILACTCFAFVNVGLLLHATEDFNMDPVIVGSVIGAVSLIGLAMRPVSAIIVDSLNRKRILIFAFALEAIATFGFAYADQYLLMYLLQIMRGIAWGLISCAGVVILVDIVGRNDIGMATGIYALGMVIGSSIAAAVVATMGDAIGFVFTFLIASLFTTISALLTITLPYKRSTPSESFGTVRHSLIENLKSVKLSNAFSLECAPIMGISFIFQLCATALGATFLVSYGRVDMDIANVGIAATIYNVIMYASRPIYRAIMDRFGARWCIIPIFIGFIVANFIVFMSNGIDGLIVAAIIYGFCSGGYSIAPRVMAIRRLGASREAVASSTSGIGNDIGMFLGNILVPAIAAASGGLYRNAYLAMSLIAFAGLFYCLFYIHLYKKAHTDNSMKW